MAHAKGLQLSEQTRAALLAQVILPVAALGGDNAEFGRIDLEQAGDEVAAALFQMAEYAHLVVEPRLGVGPVVTLLHPAIKAEADGGAEGVFDLQHNQRFK